VLLRRLVPLTVLVAALLVAGCASSEKKGPQTRRGFIVAADNVCSDTSSDLANAGSDNPTTPADITKANDVLADIYGKLARGIAGVELPASGAARRDARAFVRSVEAADPLVERLRRVSKDFERAARAKDRQAITSTGSQVRTALGAFRAARAESDRLAIALGMQVCGNLG